VILLCFDKRLDIGDIRCGQLGRFRDFLRLTFKTARIDLHAAPAEAIQVTRKLSESSSERRRYTLQNHGNSVFERNAGYPHAVLLWEGYSTTKESLSSNKQNDCKNFSRQPKIYKVEG
jgi:hypothetical protein